MGARGLPPAADGATGSPKVTALPRIAEFTPLLFWGPTLIWASTWHVILYQLAETPALDAVALRFALAAALLFAVARSRGETWRIPWRWHGWLALTGVVQYSVNYWGVYEAERHVPSGLVAVLFSLMVFGNAAVGRLMLGQTVTPRFLAAAAGGVAGVALIFWPELVAAGARPSAALGLGIGLVAVTCACVGNGLTLRLSRQGVPLVPMLAHCMGYGALALFVLMLARGDGFHVGHSVAWWVALAYLAAFGTVAAFVLYFKLAQRRGPARAALTGVAIPPIALAVSAALEGWQPTLPSLAGVALCIGSVYAATRPAPRSTPLPG
jgi:drug/metabolite transporter (DMT)-like permease